MTTETTERTISIMAGNPKVEALADGRIMLDSHLEAFEAALHLISETREKIGKIYIMFDHIGRFNKSFLRKDISRKGKEKPSLADCIPEIAETYRPLADRYDVMLENVEILTEEYVRAVMRKAHPSLEAPFRGVAGSMTQPLCEKECRVGEKPDEETEDILKISCKGIVAEVIELLARHGGDIHLFWEYNPVRCKPFTITGGIVLAEKIFPLDGKRITSTMIFRMRDGSTKSITT
ncbi:MAG: hypothetical protein NTX63_03405 [Candidatus Peregrinibacteria bacterium]|nr:hypothetical protein [Candidatus Peregrinibacteria bacterium]